MEDPEYLFLYLAPLWKLRTKRRGIYTVCSLSPPACVLVLSSYRTTLTFAYPSMVFQEWTLGQVGHRQALRLTPLVTFVRWLATLGVHLWAMEQTQVINQKPIAVASSATGSEQVTEWGNNWSHSSWSWESYQEITQCLFREWFYFPHLGKWHHCWSEFTKQWNEI